MTADYPSRYILLVISMFKVNVIARNPKREELATPPVEALVDTGSELTWLPGDILKSVGITPRRKRIFAIATQQKVEREVGYAILSAEGYETNDEVVFAETGDMTLLGVRTLEGFGVMVDNIGHRFVATSTIVASTNQRIRLNDDKSITPVKESAELGESKADRVCRTPRFPLSLRIKRGLFPQEQVLSRDGSWQAETQAQECQRISGYMEYVPNQLP